MARILDPQEVAGLKKQCEPYYGDLLAWSHVYSGLKGHIKVSGVQTVMMEKIITLFIFMFRYHHYSFATHVLH